MAALSNAKFSSIANLYMLKMFFISYIFSCRAVGHIMFCLRAIDSVMTADLNVTVTVRIVVTMAETEVPEEHNSLNFRKKRQTLWTYGR